jgi:hypothetical protein
MTTDPYNDGLAIVLSLSRPATAEDIAIADRLLDIWIEPYEQAGQCRNPELRGKVGDREIILSAERWSHPDGAGAVISDARHVISLAKAQLPVASCKLSDLDSTVSADHDEIAARLGSPVSQVKPGGDLLAELRNAGALPLPIGLRPSGMWVALVAIASFAANRTPDPLRTCLYAGTVVLGVGGLQLASRHWCKRREHALAVLTCIAAIADLLANLNATDGTLRIVARLALLGFFVAWMIFWQRRGK